MTVWAEAVGGGVGERAGVERDGGAAGATTAPVRTASKPPVIEVLTADVAVMASTLTRARPGGNWSARIEPGEIPWGTLIVTR